METAKHTPWEVAGAAIYTVNANGTNRLYAHIQPGTADDGERVGDEERHKAAAKLARACNAHDALAEALRNAVAIIKMWHGEPGWDIYAGHSPEMQQINAALAAAGVTP